MKVSELIELLEKQNPNSPVMITDKDEVFMGDWLEVKKFGNYTIIKNRQYKIPRSDELEFYLDRIEQFCREIGFYAEDLKDVCEQFKETNNG